jgi:hypothetical protein
LDMLSPLAPACAVRPKCTLQPNLTTDQARVIARSRLQQSCWTRRTWRSARPGPSESESEFKTETAPQRPGAAPDTGFQLLTRSGGAPVLGTLRPHPHQQAADGVLRLAQWSRPTASGTGGHTRCRASRPSCLRVRQGRIARLHAVRRIAQGRAQHAAGAQQQPLRRSIKLLT